MNHAFEQTLSSQEEKSRAVRPNKLLYSKVDVQQLGHALP